MHVLCCPKVAACDVSSLQHVHPVASHRHMHDPLACQPCLDAAAADWSLRFAFWNILAILQLP